MLSTGVDILHVPRMKTAIERYGQRILDRCFTAPEIKSCRGFAEEFAVRYAAKEAVSKALGVGLRVMSPFGIKFHEVEILPDRYRQAARASARLSGAARAGTRPHGMVGEPDARERIRRGVCRGDVALRQEAGCKKQDTNCVCLLPLGSRLDFILILTAFAVYNLLTGDEDGRSNY